MFVACLGLIQSDPEMPRDFLKREGVQAALFALFSNSWNDLRAPILGGYTMTCLRSLYKAVTQTPSRRLELQLIRLLFPYTCVNTAAN